MLMGKKQIVMPQISSRLTRSHFSIQAGGLLNPTNDGLHICRRNKCILPGASRSPTGQLNRSLPHVVRSDDAATSGAVAALRVGVCRVSSTPGSNDVSLIKMLLALFFYEEDRD